MNIKTELPEWFCDHFYYDTLVEFSEQINEYIDKNYKGKASVDTGYTEDYLQFYISLEEDKGFFMEFTIGDFPLNCGIFIVAGLNFHVDNIIFKKETDVFGFFTNLLNFIATENRFGAFLYSTADYQDKLEHYFSASPFWKKHPTVFTNLRSQNKISLWLHRVR
jgi:hypothetical protein